MFRLGGADGRGCGSSASPATALRNLGEGPRPYMYSRWRRAPVLAHADRTDEGDPAAPGAAVRGVVRGLDPDLAAFGVMTMDRHLDNALNLPTSSAIFACAFGSIALLLALVGIYRLVSYSVARRTREVGIRVALGATASDVVRLVLRRGLLHAALGVAVPASPAR